MSDFNILVNGVTAPAVINFPSTIKDTVVVTLVAKDGSVGRGRLVSIDTDGATLPLSAAGPNAGQLDANGQFQFIVGPGNVYGSFLRGNFSLDISVAGHTKSQNFQLA